MKNNMKNLAGLLLAEAVSMPVSVSINIHNGEEGPFVMANAEGRHFFFAEDNDGEWKEKFNYFKTYAKTQEAMSEELRKAAFDILASALKTKAYTSISLYPRQMEDDGIAFVQVYTSVGDDSIHEGIYEGRPFIDASVVKITTAHKIMREEVKDGNN